MKKISLLLLSILLTGATFAQEAVLTAWTFDNLAPSNDTSSTPLTIASNTDIGIQTGTAMIYADGTNGSSALSNAAINPQITSFSGNVMNDPRSFQSAGKALALASNSTNGKAIVFKFSTTGYQNAVITYATRGTATGFTQHAWAYSTDGVNFTSFTTLEAVTTDAWAVKTIDFSTITALNNAQNVYLQLTVTGATNATGNNRIDNFVVKAVPAGPDVYAPKIADFEVVTPTSLAITFNEPVTAATAEVATNYVLTGYNVTTATLANQVDITLTISPALVEGESYSLTVTNITDLAGNEMTDSTFSFTYGVASEFVVNSIAELRAKWTAPLNPDALTFGDIEYKLAGEVIVTAINDSYRNQKFIQDATGALVIDDQTGMIRTLDIGDKVTNFYGTLTDYYGLLQLVVTRDCSPV
ncbi:MAG: Ig-like domain-containing protein, partial [Bacteroidales bacterium]